MRCCKTKTMRAFMERIIPCTNITYDVTIETKGSPIVSSSSLSLKNCHARVSYI